MIEATKRIWLFFGLGSQELRVRHESSNLEPKIWLELLGFWCFLDVYVSDSKFHFSGFLLGKFMAVALATKMPGANFTPGSEHPGTILIGIQIRAFGYNEGVLGTLFV